MANPISFMTANYVARAAGYAISDWAHGDRTTQEALTPIETFAARFDAVLAGAQALGFDTVDVWGAHLNHGWATDAHVTAAVDALGRRGLRVASYATSVTPENAERVCELALALGTDLIGGGCSGDAGEIAPLLARHGVRLGVENHPERTPAELLATLERGGESFGATVDTGWWATWGFNAARAIDELAPRVFHVHLKDVTAAGEPHLTCRWGDGVVPVEECVRTLRRIGYQGAIAVEHEPYDRDPTEDIRAMRAELERWLA